MNTKPFVIEAATSWRRGKLLLAFFYKKGDQFNLTVH